MKKLLPFFFLLLICFPGCQNSTNTNGGNTGDTPVAKNKAIVKFENNTPCTADIYSDSARTQLLCSVNGNSSFDLELDSDEELVVYVTYHVNAGIDIPFSNDTSVYILQPKMGNRIFQGVKYPDEMNIKSSYFIIENNSSSSVEFMHSSAVFNRLNGKGNVISEKDFGVYEIRKEDFLNLSTFYLKNSVSLAHYKLPSSVSGISSSLIYTMSFTGSALELVSITPFNYELKDKIWSKEALWSSSKGKFYTDCIRTRRNLSEGSVICGALVTNDKLTPKVLFMDEKGNIFLEKNMNISKEGWILTDCLYEDFLETSDGNLVFLMTVIFSKGMQECSETYVFGWNSELSINNWKGKIGGDSANLIFARDTKGKLIEINKTRFAVCGAKYELDADENMTDYQQFLNVFEVNGQTIKTISEYESSPSPEEQVICSITYNKNQDEIIACGYKNFTGAYSNSNPHYGFVLSFDSSDVSTVKEYLIDDTQMTLFYGIDLDNKGNWYVCGETCDASNSPHGCFTSNLLVSENAGLSLYNGEKSYSWFTQICYEDSRIVMAGQEADQKDGSGGNKALVLAINKEGQKIWSNTYKDYDSVYTCMKNGAGSFLIELMKTNSSNMAGKTKIISTDMLGRDNGSVLDQFPIGQ